MLLKSSNISDVVPEKDMALIRSSHFLEEKTGIQKNGRSPFFGCRAFPLKRGVSGSELISVRVCARDGG
jgi:hypothetical protein